jgi:serine/threonine-protein kinase
MDRYERRRTIGRGMSGIVYEVADTYKDDVLAMKVFFAQAGFPKEETLLASKVTSPNVCRTYDCFYDDGGAACVTMEYVDGGTLAEFIERTGALSFNTCLPLFSQLLSGLTAISDAGVVHRDLKPGNIL